MLLAGVCACLGACLPESKNPLCPPENGFRDERLFGIWTTDRDGDKIVLHFGKGKDGNIRAVEVDHEKDKTTHATVYEVFCSTIEGVNYLNILGEGTPNANYYFARYGIDSSDVLRVWLISPDPIVKAIEAGELKGTVEDAGGAKTIRLTDSTAKLSRFVAENDRMKVFAEFFGEFRRTDLSPAKKAEGKSR